MTRRPRTAALLATALLALFSCKPPWHEWGALSIQIAEPNAKTIVPGIDMTIAEYEVSGRGPGGMQFSRSTATPSVTVMGLAFGDLNCDGSMDIFGTSVGDYMDVQLVGAPTEASAKSTGRPTVDQVRSEVKLASDARPARSPSSSAGVNSM